MLARVVLVVRRNALRTQLFQVLEQRDAAVQVLRGGKLLWKRLPRMAADLFVLDRSFLSDTAVEDIELLRGLPDSPSVVVIAEDEDPEERARFLAAGCQAVLSAKLTPSEIGDVLAKILEERAKLLSERLTLREVAPPKPRLSNFVCSSPAMQTFMQVISRVVKSDCTLLILGETGVGKEHLARGIHAEGSRTEKPFVAVNCGALPETLLESELFGHDEGAFTGATRSRRGCFELAHGGTIFLDEIGEMPRHLQVKLLRVLQDHTIQRLGSEKPLEIDVRVVAASNRDLESEAEQNQFRKDLFYRLSVVTLKVPPLRERREDTHELVLNYIDYFRRKMGCDIFGVTDEAMEAFMRYNWPGNVRELINVVERALLLCEGEEITPEDLPAVIAGRLPESVPDLLSKDGAEVPDRWLEKPLAEARKDIVEAFERTYLRGLLEATGGKINETAKRAGMLSRSLYEKMKQYGLRKEDFRPSKKSKQT